MAATILVVDDDANVRELLKLHLSAAGYEVRAAADAIAAGYLVLRSAPDLIICDINMPHMDGFEFVSALKADTTIPDIPVIFLTTFEEGDDRGKNLGVVGYLTKPIGCSRWWCVTCRAAGTRSARRRRNYGQLRSSLPSCWRAISLRRASSAGSTPNTRSQILGTTVSRDPTSAVRTPKSRSRASLASAARSERKTPSDSAQGVSVSSPMMK
jgi:CheY-like chemotaxis protein